MSHDADIDSAAPRIKLHKPAPELWTHVLVGFQSGLTLGTVRGTGAPREVWIDNPTPEGPAKLKARRVQIVASERTVYYTAGRLDRAQEAKS